MTHLTAVDETRDGRWFWFCADPDCPDDVDETGMPHVFDDRLDAANAGCVHELDRRSVAS